jgi:hypothetical protein
MPSLSGVVHSSGRRRPNGKDHSTQIVFIRARGATKTAACGVMAECGPIRLAGVSERRYDHPALSQNFKGML